jgi:hypothetical protein
MSDEIPIIRSTTKYLLPATHFSVYRNDLANTIKEKVINSDFNNAMVEVYNNYKSIGYHSDNSYVYICSFYKNREHTLNVRKLISL